MSSINFLVKLRDAAQMIADAANEQLEKMAPPEAQEHEWNPEAIKWVQAMGSRGPYMRYPGLGQKAESTDDYKNMIQDLVDHKERLTRGGYFYWLFSDGTTVGRKKRK